MTSDFVLIRKLKKGNKAAFGELYTKYKDKLYFFCLKHLNSEYLAEEALQETFIKVWKSREIIDENQNFEGFLFTLIKNTLINFIKSDKRRKNHQELSSLDKNKITEDTSNTIIFNDYVEIMNKAIDSLSQKRKEVYQLSRKEGLSHKEIAIKLGISVNTVEIHIGKALRDIKEYLEKNIGKELYSYS